MLPPCHNSYRPSFSLPPIPPLPPRFPPSPLVGSMPRRRPLQAPHRPCCPLAITLSALHSPSPPFPTLPPVCPPSPLVGSMPRCRPLPAPHRAPGVPQVQEGFQQPVAAQRLRRPCCAGCCRNSGRNSCSCGARQREECGAAVRGLRRCSGCNSRNRACNICSNRRNNCSNRHPGWRLVAACVPLGACGASCGGGGGAGGRAAGGPHPETRSAAGGNWLQPDGE